MSYTATVLKVMIASPSDVPEERKIIREVIHEWNAVNSENRGIIIMPVGWETHSSPEFGRPQAIINKQVLEGADLLVATFWTRVGSATGKAVSGTVEEIEHHLQANKPAMLYFSTAPVSTLNLDTKQLEALGKFRDECQERSLYETYESINQFREKFNRQLSLTIQRYFSDLFIRPQEQDTDDSASPLSSGAQSLLIAASKDVGGQIIRVRSFDGLSVTTNGKEYVDRGEPRSEARWDAIVDELVDRHYIFAKGVKGEVLRVTQSGYEMIDLIRATQN